jgi:3-deoxy-D-manno-octulosonic-acid transferase
MRDMPQNEANVTSKIGLLLRYLYSFLFYLALPYVFFRLWWRGKRSPDYRNRWAERLGFTSQRLDKCIWVHAVSVGETIAAIPLIKALKASYPNLPLLITNMTPTGAARVKAVFGDTVLQAYIPYDYPDAVQRFLKRVNPRVCVIIETELWPNLFAACKKNHVPLIVTNARLSEKSAKGYGMIKYLTQDMLACITKLSSQGSADADRFIELGMRAEDVVITGNLKFDLELPQDLLTKSTTLKNQLGERLIWIAASTHPTEEEVILSAHKKVKEKFPSALLILVPRHPDRFDAVAELISQQNFKLTRRSSGHDLSMETDVYLSDTMGELLLMYSVSDIAFVAGSFATIGGHNMLEAAALAKPVLTGPYLFNFAEVSEKLLTAKGMIKVADGDELAANLLQLLGDKSLRTRMGINALHVVDENKGSLQKQLDVIQSVIIN